MLQEVLNEIGDKSITHNLFRIKDNYSIMGGFFLYRFHGIYAWRKNFDTLY